MKPGRPPRRPRPRPAGHGNERPDAGGRRRTPRGPKPDRPRRQNPLPHRSPPGRPRLDKARLVSYLLLAGGVALLVYLLAEHGAELVEPVRRLGPRLALLLVFPALFVHAAYLTGWWLVVPRRPAWSRTVGPYLAGEGVNLLTGMGQVGGEPLKAQLLAADPDGGVSGAEAAASVVVARTVKVAAQVTFLLAGLAAAAAVAPLPAAVSRGVPAAVAVIVAGLVVLVLLGRRRPASLALSLAGRLGWTARPAWRDGARRFDAALGTCFELRGRLAAGYLVQLAGWIATGLELWLLFRLLGMPVSLAESLLLEAVSNALASAFFFVPGSLGVSEGARVAVFPLFGLDPALGLLAGLVRRLRDVAWGALGLAVWGWLLRRGGRGERIRLGPPLAAPEAGVAAGAGSARSEP